MTPSLRIARIFGIEIRLHVTFIALVTIVVIWAFLPGTEGRTFTLLAMAGLFGLTGLHEMGHALMAKRLGVEVQDILFHSVLPMVRLRLPEEPTTELAVAAAGPATNLLLAPVCLGLGMVLGAPVSSLLAWPPESLLGLLFWINVLMGTVNLLPAFPMDGGRILRAVLAIRLDYVVATRLAVRAGWFVVLLAAVATVAITGFWAVLVGALFLMVLGHREEQAVITRAKRRELARLRTELESRADDAPRDPAMLTPYGDFRRLRDPGFRDGFERYRERLERLRDESDA